jgi:hypothetical protein
MPRNPGDPRVSRKKKLGCVSPAAELQLNGKSRAAARGWFSLFVGAGAAGTLARLPALALLAALTLLALLPLAALTLLPLLALTLTALALLLSLSLLSRLSLAGLILLAGRSIHIVISHGNFLRVCEG